ncbi:hypothetical protein TrVFT333_008598 [Trichoderma virens FT-333]|nr:hypothetical protein TrVFT333_008598 [Trichoderma virens FT-333]
MHRSRWFRLNNNNSAPKYQHIASSEADFDNASAQWEQRFYVLGIVYIVTVLGFIVGFLFKAFSTTEKCWTLRTDAVFGNIPREQVLFTPIQTYSDIFPDSLASESDNLTLWDALQPRGGGFIVIPEPEKYGLSGGLPLEGDDNDGIVREGYATELTIKTTPDPPTPISSVTNVRESGLINDKGTDAIERSNIWLKAYDAAAPENRKWLESLPELTTLQGINKRDESWVEEIVEVIKALEKKYQESSIRITVGQREIAPRDYVAPTIQYLTMIGDIATQLGPAPSGMMWSAIKVLLQLPVTGIGETTAILASTAKILSILRRGKLYEVVFMEDNTAPELLQNLVDGLITTYAKSLDLLAYAARHLKNKYRQILEWISNPDRAEFLTAELIQRETDLVCAAECCEMARSVNADERHTELLLKLHNSIDQIDDKIRHLFDEMESQQMLEALDYFSDVKFGEQHQKKVEMRTPGTGMWLLANSKFKEWEQADGSSILWLQGTVGMGKSFLASTVIDQFRVDDAISHAPNRKNNQGFAYFYCERGSTDLREPISVLHSYVRQLSIVPCYPNLMQKKLIGLYQESRKQGVKLGLKVCKEQLFESVNLYPKTILVLDGLDECNPDTRGELIEILAELIMLAKNSVKLFISSRKEQDIAKQLPAGVTLEIDAHDNKEDIEMFVKSRIEKIKKTGKWISVPWDLQNEIRRTVCEKSEGISDGLIYRWTNYRSSASQTNKERLGKLPENLNASYEEIFQRIEKDDNREILERAVKWVTCAERSLKTFEILDAVRLSEGSDGKTLSMDPRIAEETLLDICSNLIVKDSKRGDWMFPHASVIEYFEEVHQWNFERAHSFVAKSCLIYLLSDDTTKWISEVASEHDDELSDDSRENRFHKHHNDGGNIRKYVLSNRFEHISELEKLELHEAEVSKLLRRFLGIDKPLQQSNQKYRCWVKYMNSKTNGHLDLFYPTENPAFGICGLDICHLLGDYWVSGIDILSTNEGKMDLLSIAAHRGHLKICEKLIELGSDVNRQLGNHPNDSSALTIAVGKGHIDIVRFLISQGADPNLPLNGPSALRNSISYDKSSDCLKILLRAKANPNHPCGSLCRYAYALEKAARRADIVAGKLLLKNGADAIRLSESGSYGSALAAAARGGRKDFCQLLLDRGADANALLKCGRYGSALAAAATQKFGDGIRKLLMDYGAEVNAALECGRYGSALAAAAREGNKGICHFLIQHQADVNMSLKVGKYGDALAAAARGGYTRICKLLIDHGADVNMPLKYGRYGSALAAALASDSDDTMELIRYLTEESASKTSISSGILENEGA